MSVNYSRRGGCLAQLAVALLVILVVGALIIGGTLFYAYRQGMKYTTDEPPPPPAFSKEDAAAQYELLKPRLKQLFLEQEGKDSEVAAGAGPADPQAADSAADEAGTTSQGSNSDLEPPTIRLTPADLNALAYRAAKDLPGDAYVTFSIAGNRLLLNTSIPLKGVPLLGGRFFVGTIELSEPPPGYSLPLFLQSVTAAGEPLPDGLVSRFQDPAQARKFLQANDLDGELSEVRSIRIEPDAVVVELNSSATAAD